MNTRKEEMNQFLCSSVWVQILVCAIYSVLFLVITEPNIAIVAMWTSMFVFLCSSVFRVSFSFSINATTTASCFVLLAFFSSAIHPLLVVASVLFFCGVVYKTTKKVTFPRWRAVLMLLLLASSISAYVYLFPKCWISGTICLFACIAIEFSLAHTIFKYKSRIVAKLKISLSENPETITITNIGPTNTTSELNTTVSQGKQDSPDICEVHLLEFDSNPTSDEVLNEFRQYGLRRPKYRHSLAFQDGCFHNKAMRDIIFLHKPLSIDGTEDVLMLYYLDGEPVLRLVEHDDDRFGRRLFAAVRPKS